MSKLVKISISLIFMGIICFCGWFPEYASSEQIARAAQTASKQIVIINRINKGDFNGH